MLYSVIIINYNTLELTKNCINSLLALNAKDIEIILIDNGSKNNEIKILKNNFKDKITTISNNSNLGFSKANNIAAKEAKSDILLFLNSDTKIKEDIFKSAKYIFDDKPEIGIISPLLTKPDGSKQKDAFGSYPNLKNLIFKQNTNNPNTNKVEWLSGCALFIRKKLFNNLNGFDENFFLYFEDVDLCKRAFDLGYSCYLDKSTKIIHLEGQSLNENKKRKKIYYQSQDYYFKKHYGKLNKIIMNILRFPIKVWKTT